MDRRDCEQGACVRFGRPLTVVAVPLAGGCALFVLLGTLRMMWQGWTAVPFADQWFDLLSRQSISWRWLFAQHNEHRILFPRLVFIADRFLAAETYRLDLVVNVAVQVALSVLIGRSLRAGRQVPRAEAAFCSLLVGTTLFSAMQYENFLWGYQVQFFGVFLAGSGALASATLVRSAALAVSAFAICATLATFTLANGLLCAYVAIPAAILAGRPRWVTAALALVALGLTAIYYVSYTSPSWHTNPLSSIRAPLAILAYSAAEIGSVFPPLFGGWSEPVAVAGGLAGYVLCALWLARLLASHASGGEVFSFSVATFVIATTLVTAVGRLGLQPSYAFISRYTTPALLFWAVLFPNLLIPCLRGPSFVTAPALAAGLVWMVAIARVQAPFEQLAVAEKRGLAAVAPALLAEVDDRAMLHRSDPFDTGFPIRWVRYLRAAGTSVFAPRWTRLAAAEIPRMGAAACLQDDIQVLPVGAGDRPGWRITGRLTDRGGSPHIVLFDTDGAIAGYGMGGFDGASVDRGPPGPGGRGDWWIAESRAEAAGVEGYVLGHAGRLACRLSF